MKLRSEPDYERGDRVMVSKWWDKMVVAPKAAGIIRVGCDESNLDTSIITKDGKHIRLDKRDIYYLNLIDNLTENDVMDLYR